METNEKENINLTEKGVDSSDPNTKTFFKEDAIPNISQKLNRVQVLDYIRTHSPITKYRLSKDLGIAYTTIAMICKEFEFVGLLGSRVVIGSNNRTHKEIFILEEKND